MNLSSESLSLSLLSSGGRHETDGPFRVESQEQTGFWGFFVVVVVGFFYRSKGIFTNACLCRGRDTARTLGGWLRHKYLGTYLAAG